MKERLNRSNRGWYQWKEGGHKEKVKEGEYGETIKYSCVKMKQ
jgi:hypothetical protein